MGSYDGVSIRYCIIANVGMEILNPLEATGGSAHDGENGFGLSLGPLEKRSNSLAKIIQVELATCHSDTAEVKTEQRVASRHALQRHNTIRVGLDMGF